MCHMKSKHIDNECTLKQSLSEDIFNCASCEYEAIAKKAKNHRKNRHNRCVYF